MKKKIIVVPKKDLLKEYYSHPDEKVAIISIEGTDNLVEDGIIPDNTHLLKSQEDVLNLEFDDVTSETQYSRAKVISKEDAGKIIDFVLSHKDSTLIIHCLKGKSRSQGVAKALLELFPDIWEKGGDWREIKPNPRVISEIKEEYKRRSNPY